MNLSLHNSMFGGTDLVVWGLLEGLRDRDDEVVRHLVLMHEVPCRPCNYAVCPVGYTCLEGVTVQQVLEAVEEVMK